MDRVNQLRGDGAGGSRDRDSLDGSGAEDSYLTANDTSSKYYSLSEDDFDITKDVSLASTSSETTLNDSECFSNLSPIGKKDLLDYKIGGQIEAANILSGGVNIFDDNESSYDGNELVIDDNVEIDKSPNLKLPDSGLPSQDDNVDIDKASTSKSLENPTLGQSDETEDKSLESSELVQDNVAIEQSSSSKVPEAALSVDKDEQLLDNLEAVNAASRLDQEETHANLPINEQLEDIHLPIDNSEVDIADIADLPENGVAEIALPLEEAQIGEANLPNDIGEANLPNDNVEEHVDNVAEENDNRTEVVLQIDGNNVAAINIGTGLYLYRKEGQEELAAVQIVEGEESSFKFLKVRENAEGNLEVYEEIQEIVVVPQEMPVTEVIPVAAVVTATASTSGENNNPIACELSTRKEVEKKENTPNKDDAVPSTSRQDNEANKDQGEPRNERNVNGKMVKISESRKSPLMAYHSTPNKEGIPLTKTMVDQQLHPNRHSDNVKKTIEVHTDNCKQKSWDGPSTSKCNYVSPDKKTDEASAVDKPMDEETPEKKKINLVSKEIVSDVNEKKTEDIAGCSNTVTSKVDATKANTGDSKSHKVKEVDKVPNISDEEKKNKAGPNDKSKKSVEIPSTSNYIKTPAVGTSKENKIEEKQPLTSIQLLTSTNKDVKDLNISTTPLIVAPMVIGTVIKIPEVKNINEKPVLTPAEIIQSDDMEVDEGVLVIEEQIIESQPQIDKDKPDKREEETAALAVEKKSKIIDDQIKNVLGTGEAKPSVKNSISIVGTPDISKLSNMEATTANSVKNINVISNSDKSEAENKSETGVQSTSISEDKQQVKGINSKDTHINHYINSVRNESTQERTIARESFVQNAEQSKGTATEIKTSENNSKEMTHHAVEPVIPTAKVNHTINNIHPKLEQLISKSESTDKIVENKAELPATNPRDVITSLIPVKEQRHTGLPNNTQNLIRPFMKTDKIPAVTNAAETKKEMNHKLPVNAVDTKPDSINNNHETVPFGKWTSVNRRAYVNKIKESKPVNICNANQIKQPNDLNRRDVLKKIDSQRQTYNANVKILESLNKGNVKKEAFTNKTVPETITKRETKIPVKPEAPVVKLKPILENKQVTEPIQQAPVEPAIVVTATASCTKKELERKEINNQDIIDKTVEDIINRAVTGKSPEDVKQTVTEKPIIERVEKKPEQKTNSQPTLLDAIEMKMNELHGIPFVERPPHELPRPYLAESKILSKTETLNPQKVTKIPNLLPLKSQQNQKNCEDIINLETQRENSIPSLNLSQSTEKLAKTLAEPNESDKIITEKEFDKFARRNSVTYENCLTVTDCHQVIQTVVPREAPPKKISRNEQMLAEAKAKSPHKLPIKQYLPNKSASKYADNKQYQSKLQLAYHTAVNKRIDSPITIIEDKPVKVVYLDSNVSEFTRHLNVQGRDLSPAKRLIDHDAATVGTCDSLDSDILDAIDERQDEVKTKSKHQRKQVLTPVEPDLELIEPSDLGIEVSPKKKRKIEDRPERKSLVPKKSYLLGRADVDVPRENQRHNPPPVTHNDAVSAIDNLVKAAELLENQAENMNSSVQSVDSSQSTPVKRGRGRPRKNPLPDSQNSVSESVSPQKKPKLIDAKPEHISSSDDDSDDSMIKENWTMGKINEKIVCPICNKLFRSENVVFKHVKHCTGPSPSRSESEKHSRRSRLSRESETKSRESETKSRDSRSNDPDDVDLSPIRKTPKKRMSKDSGKSSSSDDIIPVETDSRDSDKSNIPAKSEPRKTLKPKLNPRANNLVCEICGKSFRQLSYLVSHKLQHKKEENKKTNEQSTDKSVFSCETCQKEFRKLHHLVQHRLIHNPVQSRALRKTSSEQKEIPKNHDAKVEDQSAGFRCEPCDKSFRKLHHLVEHRETHDGINRQRSNSITQVSEKEKPTPPPQCDICKKTFRKLHHLIEHKEQHQETSSEKSDDQKSVKSSLSTKDIIHECNLCYMVFPNEHSLTKHTVICLRKKKQSAAKQAAAQEEKSAEDAAKAELSEESKIESVKEAQPVETQVEEQVEKPPEKPVDPPKSEVHLIKEDPPKPEIVQPVEKVEQHVPKEIEKKPPAPDPLPKVVKPAEAPKKLVEDIIVIEDTPVKKKAPIKDKIAPSVTKRQKLTPPTEERTAPSSDDDEVRYMFNPDFKASETLESKTFTKIRAKKRNSLQFGPQKDVARRRSLLQHPPKIPRLRSKSDDVIVSPKPVIKPKEEIPSTDSDDSDVKYSFPPVVVKPEKQEAPEKEPKRRKTMAEKRKSLSGIAKRKSLGKAFVKSAAKPSPAKPIKRRTAAAEHRCDCGQLFSSAALLARHASLAHTPPRVRRVRDNEAGNSSGEAAGKSGEATRKSVDATKKSVETTKKNADATRKSVEATKKSVDSTRKSVETTKKSVDATRKSVAADTAGKSNRKSSVEQPRKSVASNSVEQRKSVVGKNRKSSVEKKNIAVASASKDSARKSVKKTPGARNRVHTGVPLPQKRPSRK